MKTPFILSLVTILLATPVWPDDRIAADRSNKAATSQVPPAAARPARPPGDRLLDGRYWKLEGNNGTRAGGQFLGTTDRQPLELRVHRERALRLEPTTETPNLIGGWWENRVEPGNYGVTIGGGGWKAIPQLVIGTSSYFSTISGGAGNSIQTYGAAIGGGVQNSIEGNAGTSVIGGGQSNTIKTDEFGSAGDAIIGGGTQNEIQSALGVIAGGAANRIEAMSDSTAASIGGGQLNLIERDAYGSAIVGGWYNAVHTNATFGSVGGGLANEIAASYGTIGGGMSNVIAGPFAGFATVAGGRFNVSFNAGTTIGGGSFNICREPYATIAGGQDNRGEGEDSTIGGGAENIVSGDGGTIGGGVSNRANGKGATVPGGFSNLAGGRSSLAAGRGANAGHDGALVWADFNSFVPSGEPIPFGSESANEFAARATGGVRFVTGISPNGAVTAGVSLPPGGGAWATLSDRNAKENFSEANGRDILERLADLPIPSWNYQAQGSQIRHLGPTAQDFQAAFHLGENDRTISTVDADGVALAAIQGLNQKVEEKEARICALEETVAELKAILLRLARSEKSGR